MDKPKESNIWFTPTSYGLVLTKINKQKKLKRIYLDKEATNELIQNKSDKIYEKLEKKGIKKTDITPNFIIISKDIERFNKLIYKNKWKLFSLYPLQYSIQTVNFCNANCDFCYANINKTNNIEAMDKKTIYALKDYAALHGIKFGVSGGEPLLHPDIYKILSYKNNLVYDTLITNLTANFDYQKLIQTKVDLIQVSIHGYGKTHDDILGIKDAYKTVRKRIIELNNYIIFGTNTVITPTNIDTIEKLIQDFNNIQKETNKKFSYIRFVPVLPSGTGLNKYKTNLEFINNVRSKLKSLMNKYKDLEFEIPILHSNPYEYYYDDKNWVCPAGSTVAVIRIDGKIIPCNQFLDTNITSKYSINDKNFEEIWLNDPILSDMRKGITTEINDITCEECRYLTMKEHNQLF